MMVRRLVPHILTLSLIPALMRKVAANIIAENMYAQIDDEGNSYLLLDEIEDRRKEGTALTEQDAYVYRGHNKHRKPTTKGWELLVSWKDGSNSWVKLKDMLACIYSCTLMLWLMN